MKSSSAKLVVISGCSGGGKSSLLAELKKQRYETVPEAGREIVKEQLAINGNQLPWMDSVGFCELLIAKSIQAYQAAAKITSAKDQLIFMDRSVIEGISYYQTLAVEDTQKYNELMQKIRYFPLVFMAPPWQEIFCEDAERQHSFNQAVEEYQRLLSHYVAYGYQLVTLPKLSIPQRCRFILTTLT